MILVLALLVAGVLEAQVASTALFGEVRDPSGAVVPGAVVTVRSAATGFARTTISSSNGSYRLDELQPGSHTVTAGKRGFRTLNADGITLAVNQTARLDFRLELGAEREVVTITASVSGLETASAAVGYRIEPSAIQSLPLAERNLMSLVTLGPGAIPRHLGGFVRDVTNDIQAGSRGSVAFNAPVNGNRSTMNAYTVDGASDTDRNTFAIAVIPPLGAVQEFRMQSALAPAEFTQAGGGVVDVVTRSGARDWHGNVFGYFRNEALDARNYFEDAALPRPVFRQNQFGGSLGGPAFPSATFFFVSYEGLRGKAGNPSMARVPEPAPRGGDFRDGKTIFDPLLFDSATGGRLPFAGNVIPEARIDPIARRFLDRFEPLPNHQGTAGNYLDATPTERNLDTASARVDHQFRDQSRLFARYTVNDSRDRIAATFPVLPASERLRAQQGAVGFTSAGAGWIHDARVSYTRLRLFDVPETAFRENLAQSLGIGQPPTDPFTFGLPYFLVADYSLVTDSPTLPQVQRDNLWNVSDGVSFGRGRHTWNAGGEWTHAEVNYQRSQYARGQYTFTGAFTANPADAGGSGEALADFLLGLPQVTSRNVGTTLAYLRQNIYATYLHHEWRAADRLTLNLGLRYEYVSPFTEARGNLFNLDYTTLPQPPRLARVQSAVRPDRNNVAPRLGVAWMLPRALSFGRDTVLRAGYGIYYSPEIATEVYDLILNGIRSERNQTDGSALPILTIANGFPRTASTGFPSYYSLDPGARTPYVQQWTAGLRREAPGGVLAEVAYIGTKGTKLGRFRRRNTPLRVELGENLPARPGDLQSLRPFPELGTIYHREHASSATYHSLQVQATRRFSQRFGLLASFVWSKSIDDADSVIPGLFESFGAQDEQNLRLERGLSFFNVGRRISAGLVCELPSAPVLRPFLAHWSMSGIVTLQDGTPLNPVYFATDFANSGTPNRPDVVPGQKIDLPRSQRTIERFFNTGAFRAPPPNRFGNAGRNIIPGPGNSVVDLSLHRRFPLRDGGALEFRAESFNAFNHPNWGIPGPYPDFGPFFGRIFATGAPRRLQLALRYDF